jgi:hypothetical protein
MNPRRLMRRNALRYRMSFLEAVRCLLMDDPAVVLHELQAHNYLLNAKTWRDMAKRKGVTKTP